jgi:hypothetical protein
MFDLERGDLAILEKRRGKLDVKQPKKLGNAWDGDGILVIQMTCLFHILLALKRGDELHEVKDYDLSKDNV